MSSPDIDSLHLCPLSDTQTASHFNQSARTEPREPRVHSSGTGADTPPTFCTRHNGVPNGAEYFTKSTKRLPFVRENKGAPKGWK